MRPMTNSTRLRLRLLRGVILVAAGILLSPPAVFAQGIDLDTVRAGQFDYGKMWTFEYPPQDYFTATYGFEANDQWFERIRLAALRIPGCSASFVSPNGLMATNHHCVRGVITRVAQAGERLLDDGFYAQTLDQERRIPGYYADQLIAVRDVSDEVFAAIDRATTDEARNDARRDVLARIEERLRAEHTDLGAQLRVQFIPLYNGGRYSAYVFRRFTDVRLVVAAELQMGFFGGDYDNFTYPRYDLDFAFIRVYDDNGQPFHTDHYFRWGQEGVEEGDIVFVVGNPGSTRRLNTIAQLEFQRDVSVPAVVAALGSRLTALYEFYDADPARGDQLDIRNRAFGLSNTLKATGGRFDALKDPAIMARKADAERQLRDAIRARPELQARYGNVLDRIAQLQEQKRELAAPWAAFQGLGIRGGSSSLMQRAMAAYEYLQAERRGAPADSVARLKQQILRVSDQPDWLDQRFLMLQLREFADAFGSNHAITRIALAGRTPEDGANRLLATSALASAERTAQAVEAGLSSEDPAINLANAFMPLYIDFAARLDAIESAERELASDLGRVRFEVYGEEVPPDGSSSPRITDGVVKSYEYNGTVAPAYTTFYGLYDRYYSHGPGTEWELPARWKTPPAGLDLGTPLNFASTCDTYGGNSGSPAITPDLALVGLNFDRNVEGLSRDFIYLPDRGRNIMVDVRAIQAALDNVYDADRIVQELLTGRLFRTEAEADRM